MTTPQYAQGWFPDPTRRHRLRWSDGTAWTDWVADGLTALSESEPDRTEARRRTRVTGRVLVLVAGLCAALLLVFGAFAYMVESETSSEMNGLRRELNAIEVPDSVVRTRASDLEMPANFGANGGSIERTYRPAAGVPVAQAAADFAAALQAQGYDLDRTDYTYRQQQLTGWSGRCRATSFCSLDLDYLGDRITLRLGE